MDKIVDGQFDDADDDCSIDSSKSKTLENISICNNSKSQVLEDGNETGDENEFIEGEESEDEPSLESVEWNSQTRNATKQYLQFTGKLSLGTNPQNPSKNCHESIVKRFQNRLNLGTYNPPSSKSFRKTDNHASKYRDKSDQATLEKALDNKTMMILYKMLNKVYSDIDGCVSTGKEANVYHATAINGRSLAVKVFKTIGSEFRNREKYMAGEFRFQRFRLNCSKDIRKLVPKWAEKEFRNLHRIYKSGIPSPEPIFLNGNVLVMEFLGEDGRPAAKLKDVNLTFEEAEQFYVESIKMMRKIFQECKLVHADLSEFNMLVLDGRLHIIDVSQSVEMDNENALKFLKMDITNVTMFFRKEGVTTMTLKRLFEFIVSPEIDEELFIQNATNDVATGKDTDENDQETEHVIISRTSEENDYITKDMRRVDDKTMLLQPLDFSKKEKIEEPESDDDVDCRSDDEEKDEEGNDSEKAEDDDGKDTDSNQIKVEQQMFSRPRDESPTSRKERKKAVKEVQKTNRQNKIPKAEKKRRIKISKNKKS